MTATKSADINDDSASNTMEDAVLENEQSWLESSEEDVSPTLSQHMIDETGDAKPVPVRNFNPDCANSNCGCCARAKKLEEKKGEDFNHLLNESFEETPLLTSVVTIIGYGVLVVFGYLRDWLRRYGFEAIYSAKEPNRGPGRLTELMLDYTYVI